jgi:hypothetical protein
MANKSTLPRSVMSVIEDYAEPVTFSQVVLGDVTVTVLAI